MTAARQEPPHSLEAEQAVLGAMFCGREAVVKATSLLTAEDFYREAHKLIFAGMQELTDAGRDVDYINLLDHFTNKQELDKIGGLPYLMSLSNASVTATLIEQHAAIVKNNSLKRQLIKYGRMVAAGGESGRGCE